MEIDDARSGSQLTRSKTDEDGGSLLKSRSPPTIRNTVGAIKPAPQLLPPLQALANVTAESSKKSSYASDSSSATVASKPMGTGFNGNMYEGIQKLRTAIAKPRLIGCQAATRHWSTNLGDLASEGWKGVTSAHYRHLYDAKMNISTSFNPQNLRCDV